MLDKVLVKLNLKEETLETDWTMLSWESSLSQMDYDADVVFFGDSITRGGDFQEYFPDVKIVNMGISGNSLERMLERTGMIQTVTPEKIFLLGGINSLTASNFEETLETYTELLEQILEENPDAEVYVQSLLPVTSEKEEIYTDNETIEKFNAELEALAVSHGLSFINLYDLYVENGYMNSELTSDGVHLQEDAYDLWAAEIEQYIY